MIKKIDDVIMISVKTILSQCVAEILSEYQAIIVTKVNYMWFLNSPVSKKNYYKSLNNDDDDDDDDSNNNNNYNNLSSHNKSP